MRIALKFAYNGKQFSGYARQPGQRTVEQTLLGLLADQGIVDDPRLSCFRTASRTDRGVSALGNVCAFHTPLCQEEVFSRIRQTGPDLFVYGIQEVDDGFYPRHAKQRQYRYYLRKTSLDIDKVLCAAGLFTGEHNFQNFARIEPLKNPIRSIDTIVLSENEDFFVLDFYAQTFLWNQIRRIVSAVKKAGEGSLSMDAIREALSHPERTVDFQVAPSEPLLLVDVVYDFSFEYVNGFEKNLQDFEAGIISCL